MILSLIIPAYNVENYIEECLLSIFKQPAIDNDDIEIIIINDGSTDNTLGIINNLILDFQHLNIIIYSQENKGLSATRNFGLGAAKGEYVWFIDSDDWIEDNSLKEVSEYLIKRKPEILTLETEIHENRTEVVKSRNLLYNNPYKGVEIFSKSWIYPYSGAQFYIFNREFLNQNNLRFEEGIFFEDMLFTPRALDLCKFSICYDKPIYHYRIRSNSITTTTVNRTKADSYIHVMRRLLHYIDDDKVSNPLIYEKVSLSIMNILCRLYINKLPKLDSNHVRIEILSNNGIKKILKKRKYLKYRIPYFILKYFPLLSGKII